jgi:hypothetical protein
MLATDLTIDIEERKAVLTKVKTFHLRNRLKQEDKDLFLSYSVPAIYAIWEGFVQTSFRRYLIELNGLRLPLRDIHDSIVIFHMENTYKQFKEYPSKIEKN